MADQLGLHVAQPPTNVYHVHDLRNWALHWLLDAGHDERSTMLQGVYGLWLTRNATRDGSRIATPQDVARSVADHLKKWVQVHVSGGASSRTNTVHKWEAPEPGWIMANADGAISKSYGSAGAGAILRNADGGFIAATCHASPGIQDSSWLNCLHVKEPSN